MQNVSKSVTQNMIAWKNSFGCAHFVVKINKLTLSILLKFLNISETKVVDDIVRTVRGDTKELLDAVNNHNLNL